MTNIPDVYEVRGLGALYSQPYAFDVETRTLRFDSTGEAYDAIQCAETPVLADGVVFEVPGEKVVGVVWTWPIAADHTHAGDLHTVDGPEFVTDRSIPIEVRIGWLRARERAAELGWLS